MRRRIRIFRARYAVEHHAEDGRLMPPLGSGRSADDSRDIWLIASWRICPSLRCHPNRLSTRTGSLPALPPLRAGAGVTGTKGDGEPGCGQEGAGVTRGDRIGVAKEDTNVDLQKALMNAMILKTGLPFDPRRYSKFELNEAL